MSKENRFADVQINGSNNTTTNNNQQATAVPADDTSSRRDRARERNTNNNTGNYRGVGLGVVRRSMSRHATNAVVATAINTFTNLPAVKTGELQSAYADGTIRFLTLDSEQENTPISAVLFCEKCGNDVAVVNLGLASTVTDPLGDFYIEQSDQNYNNRRDPISVPRTPGDIYNDVDSYAIAIESIVKKEYPGCNIHLAGQMILQESLDLTSHDKMHAVLFRCIDAAEGFLSDIGVLQQDEGFNLAEFTKDSDELRVKITMGGKDGVDDLGNVRRQDITLMLNERYRQRQYGQDTMQMRPIVGVKGFIDVCYVGVDDRDVSRDSTVFEEGKTAVYMPTFVITELDTLKGGVTLQHLIASIITSNILIDKNRWVAAFRPEYAHNDPYRFVGALSRDVPEIGTSRRDPVMMPEILPEANFDYVQFCRDAFYMDEIGIALDIEAAGQIAPLTEIILNAAYENKDDILALVSATDTVLNGSFAELWEAEGCPTLVTTDGTMVPMGNYPDANGERRDPRNIDLLALQHMKLSQNTIMDFTDAYYDGDKDPMERASNLVRILNSVMGSLTITGWAQRVYFTNEFFELVKAALDTSGIRIRPDSSYDLVDGAQTRGVRSQRSRGVRSMAGVFSSNNRRQSDNGRSRNYRRASRSRR